PLNALFETIHPVRGRSPTPRNRACFSSEAKSRTDSILNPNPTDRHSHPLQQGRNAPRFREELLQLFCESQYPRRALLPLFYAPQFVLSTTQRRAIVRRFFPSY